MKKSWKPAVTCRYKLRGWQDTGILKKIFGGSQSTVYGETKSNLRELSIPQWWFTHRLADNGAHEPADGLTIQ